MKTLRLEVFEQTSEQFHLRFFLVPKRCLGTHSWMSCILVETDRSAVKTAFPSHTSQPLS